MRLRRAPLTASFTLLVACPALFCQTAPQQLAAAGPGPHAGDTGHPTDPPAAKDASSRVLFFYTAPRSTIEMEVHSIPPTSRDRFAHLREAFAAVGCSGDRMQEQRVIDKHGDAGSNLICTWPGSGSGTIVVVAHYEHDGRGQGALADWSGAALLPFLYLAIQGQPRENSFVFLESWTAHGAHTWLHSLSKSERKGIRAMIDLDALGLGVTRYFTPNSFMENLPPGADHLQTELLWAAVDDGLTHPPENTPAHHWLSEDSTDPFRAMMIPTIVIHSVPPGSSHLPGSAADIASAVDGNAYFQTYRLMCTYLTSLDRMAKELTSDDPIWTTPHFQNAQNAVPTDEDPRVTFRPYPSWRTTH